jgi:hypothetical protein
VCSCLPEDMVVGLEELSDGAQRKILAVVLTVSRHRRNEEKMLRSSSWKEKERVEGNVVLELGIGDESELW